MPSHQRIEASDVSYEPVEGRYPAPDNDEIVRALGEAIEAIIRRRRSPDPQLPVIA